MLLQRMLMALVPCRRRMCIHRSPTANAKAAAKTAAVKSGVTKDRKKPADHSLDADSEKRAKKNHGHEEKASNVATQKLENKRRKTDTNLKQQSLHFKK